MMAGGSNFPLLSSLNIQNEIYETNIDKKKTSCNTTAHSSATVANAHANCTAARPAWIFQMDSLAIYTASLFVFSFSFFIANIYSCCVKNGNRIPKSEIELFCTSTGTIFDESEVINILLLRKKKNCIVNYGVSGCRFMVNAATLSFSILYISIFKSLIFFFCWLSI